MRAVGTELQWAFAESEQASPDQGTGPWFVYDYLSHCFSAQPGVEVVRCGSEPSRQASGKSSSATPSVTPAAPENPAGWQGAQQCIWALLALLPMRFADVGGMLDVPCLDGRRVMRVLPQMKGLEVARLLHILAVRRHQQPQVPNHSAH